MIGLVPADVPSNPKPILSATLPLTMECSTSETSFYELVVTVAAGPKSTYTPTIDVSYEGDGGNGVLTVNWGVRVCVDESMPECKGMLEKNQSAA